jgi:uncharacterized membrane protein
MAARFTVARFPMTPVDSTWFLPSGVPNLHPMLVHFPIGILTTAVVFDLFAFSLNQRIFLKHGAASLYLLGTIAMAVAYLSGREAAVMVFTPGIAHGLVGEHWTWAMWTLVYFSMLTFGRLVANWFLSSEKLVLWTFFLIGGIIGLLILTVMADRGARLVYEYGVGVLGVH